MVFAFRDLAAYHWPMMPGSNIDMANNDDVFSQRQLNTIYLPYDFSRVILDVTSARAQEPNDMSRLYMAGSRGGQVPIDARMQPVRSHAAMWVRHNQQMPASTVSFATRPGVAISRVLDQIKAAEARLRLPDGVFSTFIGQAAAANRFGTRLLFLSAASIYIVLGVLYESLVKPLVVLSAMPAAAFGALAALWSSAMGLSIIAAEACILVVGMVLKNSIVLVDRAMMAEGRGLPAQERFGKPA